MAERIALAELCVAPITSDAPVSRVQGVAFSRSMWLDRVQAWSAAFAGIAGRDLAFYFEDALEFSAALFGAWQAGKTPWLLGDALTATVDRLASQAYVLVGTLPEAMPTPGSGRATLVPLDPSVCDLVLYTSGTSGDPTAIRKSLRQLDAEVAALEAQFGARLADAMVQGTVSHQHIYGLLFRVLWPLSSGRAFAGERLQYPEQIAALRERACALIASPAHLKRLPEALDWSAFAPTLRGVFSSGGPLPQEAAQDVERRWARPAIEVLGSTETGGIAWREGGASGVRWSALPGVQWRITADTLEVRSPHLSDVEWYTTQDRARAVEDGFELLGRADRIVKLEERRIALGAIERRLLESPLVTEVRVIALTGVRTWLAAVVVLSPVGQALQDAQGKPAVVQPLRAWLDGHIDPIAWPRRWRFVPALPVDTRGKTSERALQALFRPTMPEPKWQRRGLAHAELELDVEPDLAAFEGHFPETPVLPGVILLDWVMRLANDAFGLQTACRQMEALKFHHVVQPGARLHLDLRWQAASGVLEFRYRDGERAHASGRLRFEVAETMAEPRE